MMRRLFSTFVLLCSLSVASCAHVTPAEKAQLARDEEKCAVDFGAAAVMDAATGVLADTGAAITGGVAFDGAEWKARGLAIAARDGAPLLACAVSHLLADLSGSMVADARPVAYARACSVHRVDPRVRPYLERLLQLAAAK